MGGDWFVIVETVRKRPMVVCCVAVGCWCGLCVGLCGLERDAYVKFGGYQNDVISIRHF